MRRRATILSLCLLAAWATAESVAQSQGQSPFEQEFLRTFPQKPEESTPQLSFRLLNEIELPGPLPGTGPALVDDRITIPVSGHVARTSWAAGSTPELMPAAEEQDETPVSTEPAWVEDPSGRRRYRTLPEGRLVAEKRCRRCDRGWRKLWRLRLPGSTVAPPLVTEDRIFVGAMDNRIYSLKRRNGHRMWTADAESRLTRRLVLYTVGANALSVRDEGESVPADRRPLQLVLAVPDDRAEIQAWSARTGRKVATFKLAKDEGELIGVPLATPDEKLVVARQGYQASQASLMVLQMTAPPTTGPAGGDAATASETSGTAE